MAQLFVRAAINFFNRFMSPFFSGILSLLTGGISNIFESGGFNNLGNVLNNAGTSANDIGNQNMAGNFIAKTTGSRLTDAEREANQWTAEREDIAWQRQMEASNTAYQRQVEDMKAAGLNPMMAASSGGASSPSMSTSGSVQPGNGNLGSLLSVAIQAMLAKADIGLKNAEAAKLRSETEGQDIANEIAKLTKDGEVSYRNMRSEVSRSQINEANKRIDEMAAHISKMAEEAKTEESKRQANLASAMLANMNAFQAMAMLPYEQAYKSAATEEAKQAALLAAAHSAYQHKLIDDGYLDAFIAKEKSEASTAEAKAELDVLKAAIRSGDYSKVNHKYSLTGDILSTFAILLDNFNPLNGIFK